MTTTEVPSVTGASEEAAAPVSDQNPDVQPDQVERQVPLAALESERTQRQQMQEELKLIKEHMNLLQARQVSTPSPPQESSLNDDDVMTYGEFKKVAIEFLNPIKGTLNEMQMSKKHGDYDEVVRKYLPGVIKDDPSIAETLRNTQDFGLAYRLAKTCDSYRNDHHQEKKSSDAERLIANSQHSGTLSSVGGTTPISMVKRYKDMSDTDFKKEMAKNIGYS